jgi:hypothetical protein
VKVTIVRTQIVKSADLARAGRDDMLVIYTTDTGRSDSVTVPAEDATATVIQAAIQLREKQAGQLHGQQFEV